MGYYIAGILYYRVGFHHSFLNWFFNFNKGHTHQSFTGWDVMGHKLTFLVQAVRHHFRTSDGSAYVQANSVNGWVEIL